MGGDIDVESTVGIGSTFTLRLEAELAERTTRRSLAPLAALPSFQGRGRVLVAEDNPINREVAGEFLEELGCEVDFADNGLRAVEALEQRDYALVLMDCQMPELDGYEATRRIRAREKGRRTSIVACTAHAFEAEREKSEASGMDAFLSKPLTLTALAEVLTRFLGTETAARANVLEPGLKRTEGLIRVFREHVPAQVERIARAVERGDSAEVKLAAHRVKGSSLAFGAPRLVELCRELEQGRENLPQLVTELEAELGRVLGELGPSEAVTRQSA
jgi:CheY-like chemotaxis protein/HPt (histidine-containing phosphotransfer) domain-containing protein